MQPTRPKRPLTTTVSIVIGTLLLGAGVAAARPPPPGEPPPAAPAAPVTPPVLRSRVDATYPPDAERDRLEATVVFVLVVAADGHVEDARVFAPAGHGFDEAALDAVRKFSFEPARKEGVAIRASVKLAYEFHLHGGAPVSAQAPAAAPAAPAAPPAPVSPAAPAQRDLEVTVAGERPTPNASLSEPEHIAASDSSTSQNELSLRPRQRAEGVLETVPGLFTVQHAGGGKAQQYFLRGFDLDHGTDFAVFVDGLPVNAVSHAHGQGFCDLHFVIPETIDTLESTKGPYSARVGDFATAGSVSFHMADHVDESLGKIEYGQNGHKRAVVVESPDLGDSWRMAVAAELFNEDGPFIHPENYDRFNVYAKVTRVLDERSEVSAELMAYGGSWNMSGVLPARAVCGDHDYGVFNGVTTVLPSSPEYSGEHCINRFDSIDPSQGGASQRYMALTAYRRRLEDADFEATLFGLHSNFQLFPNDGIAASFQPAGMQYGSQVEQDDDRTELGANIRYTRNHLKVGSLDVRSTVGLQIRYDGVASQLHRDEQRQRLDGMPGIPGPIIDSGINETELGAYFEEDWRVLSWLRFVLGGRADRIDADVSNESPVAVDKVSGYKGATQLSPKASMVVYPVSWLDLFADYGRGFHTNDIRSLLSGNVVATSSSTNFQLLGKAPTLIATATGYEVGATVRPVKGLSLSATAFLLDLTSELTIDGDTASTTTVCPVQTSTNCPTRRYGGELTGHYQFRKDIYADASFTVAHARYDDATDIDAGQSLVSLAPVRTFSAGVGVREPVGPITIIAGATVRSMSDRSATNDGTLTATGFTVFNAEAGIRFRFVEVSADLLNIANTVYREGQFAVNSRLPGEGPNPPQGVSFTPGTPRTVIGHAIAYW
jgi:TonB family protein